jgi:hypothetical protein
MTTSLRTLSLHCALALALALAAILATAGAGAARAATHPPMLSSDSGWTNELVNHPNCGSDGDDEGRPTCAAVRR